MAINKIKLGTLYQNNIPINYSNSPVVYTTGSILELKSSSSNLDEIIEWVSFTDGTKQFLISTKNILSNISYNSLLTQALVNGNSIITLGGTKYKIRLLTSEEYDKYICNSINLTSLLTPTTQDKTEGGWTDGTISSCESNILWNWWKSQSITQTITSSNATIRGGTTINGSDSLDVNSVGNYRIILDKYNYPPSIKSANDGSLGSKTSNIIQKYTVTDADNDLFKVEEFIDASIVRTLENQSSDTEFTFTLTNTQWTNLGGGQHTITIIITDTYGNIVKRIWTFNKIIDTSTGFSLNLTKPIINVSNNSSTYLNPINALEDNKITFSVIGGEIVYSNEINIVDNENVGTVVYSKKSDTFDFYNTIPSGILSNGEINKQKTYQIKIRTYTSNGQYSAWSDVVLVKCLTPPTLMVTNIIDDMIETPNPVMQATYSQLEGDELYTYVFNLLKDGVQIASSGVLLDKKLQYQFSDLENKTNYVIQLKVKTASGMEEIIEQNFYCMYLQSKLPAIMELENDSQIGAVRFKTYVRQILGRIYSGDDITYIDGEWADLHNTVVIWDKDSSFKLNGNWTAKIWARDLEDNNVMLVKFVLDDDNYIELTRWANIFYLTKYVSGIKLYQLHSEIKGDILSTDELYFFIQNDVDMGLMNFDIKRVTNGRNTWFSKSYIDDVEPSYYNEDGFLTFLPKDLKNILLDTNIDGESIKIYIPSIDELANANTESIIGQAIIGQMILGNSNIVDISDIKPYFTRSVNEIDSNKLNVINIDETITTGYPNDSSIGIRFVIKIASNTKVSTYKNTIDNCYNFAFSVTNLFDIQNVSNLNIGEKVKSYSIKYNNELIKFTVLTKTDTTVSLLSNVINTNKEFDKEETTHINGNTNWNLSNIKQWLNSNIKIG